MRGCLPLSFYFMTETAVQEAPPEIITSVPEDFMREFEKEILGQIPEEKVQADLRQAKIAKQMGVRGSRSIEGIGQHVAEIDRRLFFRLQNAYSKNYDQKEWLTDFLADNKQLCCPGYNPKRKNDLRHSMTFVNGAPVRNV